MNSSPVPQVGRAARPGMLVVLAPSIAEILPGATRISSLFVFPIEMGIWGTGALLIRAAVRRWKVGWLNMLLLGLRWPSPRNSWSNRPRWPRWWCTSCRCAVRARLGHQLCVLLWALFYEPLFRRVHAHHGDRAHLSIAARRSVAATGGARGSRAPSSCSRVCRPGIPGRRSHGPRCFTCPSTTRRSYMC